MPPSKRKHKKQTPAIRVHDETPPVKYYQKRRELSIADMNPKITVRLHHCGKR
jgi:hypothetical protein